MVTLARYLARHGRLRVPLGVAVADLLATALAECSTNRAALLDLRPECLDFEFDPTDGRPRVVLLKPTGDVPLAPYVAWPEIAEIWAGLRSHTDSHVTHESAAVYCCTWLLYDMLVGRPPHAADELFDLALACLQPWTPDAAVRQLPERIVRLLERGLAHDPSARFGSLAELRAELHRAVATPHAVPVRPKWTLANVATGHAYLLAHDANEVRIGRNHTRARHRVDLDLSPEPRGISVHRQQAILCATSDGGWTVEDWLGGVTPRSTAGGATTLNGQRLAAGERRKLSAGDRLGFGAIVMRIDK